MPGGDGNTVVYDTVAGTIRATARTRIAPDDSVRADTIAFQNVPAFVWQAGVPIAIGTRRLRADIAFGGAFYAIVDSEAAGVGVNAANACELRRAGNEIKQAVDAAHQVVHPTQPHVAGVFGTIFTGPPSAQGADLKNVTVFGDGQIARSPGGTGTAAVMAVVAEMGLFGEDAPFVHEGAIGTVLRGRISGRTSVGEREAIVCELEGSAWITGDHWFTAGDADPLREGTRV
jgi:proline racemase